MINAIHADVLALGAPETAAKEFWKRLFRGIKAALLILKPALLISNVR
jgi:hypothetical protein